MNSKVFVSCVLLLCLFGMSSFAAPLTPPLADTPPLDDDVMAELSSISATLGSSDSETEPEAVQQEVADAEVDLVQTASSMHNDFASTSVGGYTFYRVPFTSSTSSNVDIRNTCAKHDMIAPCDAGKGYSSCDGCTLMPTETLSSKCGNQHFSYGGYVPPNYKETDCYKNWPGDKGAWEKFMPDTHIMQNWNCGSGKSVVSLKVNYQPDFSGSSKGFALCARKQTRRDDTEKYAQKHAEESNQILNLLDGIKAKILASQNVWSKTTLPNAQKDVEVTTAALAKAQEQKGIADIELRRVNKDMEDAVRRNEREISMIEQIQAHIHSLNGRGADTCSGLPDGLHATKDDGAQIFCKGGMVRIVQALASDKWNGDYRSIFDRDWFSSGTAKSPVSDKSYVLDNLMTQNIIKTSGKWAIEIVRKSDGVTGRVEYSGSPKDVFSCASGGHCEMTYAAKFSDNTGVRYSGSTKVCYNAASKSRGFQGVNGMNFMGATCANPSGAANTNCDYGPWTSQILITKPHWPSFSPSFGISPVSNPSNSYDFFVYVA